MDLTRTFDILDLYRNQYKGKADAFAGKVNKQWIKHSSEDYVTNAESLSYGLLAMGIGKGDKIVTISNNRPEWNFLDMAMSQMGVIHVPLFTTLTEQGYIDNINDCGAVMVMVSDKRLVDKITSIRQSVGTVQHLYSFDEVESVGNWKEILKSGQEKKEEFAGQLEELKSGIKPDDCVTLIYTSGTTGDSKGVLLSHRNLLSTAQVAANVFELQSEHRYLSILPICHVGERMGCYQTQLSGCSIYYAENLATIAADLQDIKPHGFGAVPRILEKVYDKIIARGKKLTGIKKTLFFWALDLGLKYKINGQNGPWYELQLSIANKLIFSKWREAMGGNVISIGVGGAALQPHLERVFWSAGIKLLNMYGLTETAPIITINRAESPLLKLGTVGAKVDGVDVKIAEDGEILCKGPNVMLGYYNNEEATKDVLVEGWFHTGDIGNVDEDGFLRITDRKKEIFKLSNGKYVSPQAIENKFKESVYVDQLMVVGEGEKFTSAIISANFEALNAWCSENGIKGSKEEKIRHPEVGKLFNGIVSEFNQALDKDEKIKRHRLVADEWTPDSGELSPTLKLKRKIIAARYDSHIKEVFRHAEEAMA